MNSGSFIASLALAIGFALTSLSAADPPGNAEESLLWFFPATDELVRAIKRVEGEKKLELHEILSGNSFGIGRRSISLKVDGQGNWRFEYFTGYTNAKNFMEYLFELQGPERKIGGPSKSEVVIYKILIDHVVDPLVASEIERERRYEKKLRFFQEYWEDVVFQALPRKQKDVPEPKTTPPGNNGEKSKEAEQGAAGDGDKP